MTSTILQSPGIQTHLECELFVQVCLQSESFTPEERLGLIRARIMGGNAAKGDYIVFLDAHCRVSPRWLETPYKLISEVFLLMKFDWQDARTIVNFVDFILDADFNVKPATAGIGR